MLFFGDIYIFNMSCSNTVHYGVFVLVMRVLGIPARVVTNYNSGHDTNANLLIEENYNEKGEKLPGDSIW